jgi:tetratricopeptide (TPR) repeat protein
MRRWFAVLALALGTSVLCRPGALRAQTTAQDSAAAALLRARADSADKRLTEAARREAIELRRQAAELYRRAGDRRDEGQMLHTVGRTYLNLGQLDSALTYYGRALAIRRDIHDRGGEGSTLGAIGNVRREQGRPDSALHYYQQALEILRAVSNRSAEGATLTNIGSVYGDLGRPNSALRYYRQALAVYHEVGERQNEAKALSNIGATYADLGRRDSVVSYYVRALEIQRGAGDLPSEGTTLGNIGAVYAERDRLDSAMIYSRQALAIQHRLGDRRREGVLLNNIAVIYRDLGRLDSALSYHVLALAMQREVGDRAGEATTLHDLGSFYAGRDGLDSAASYYQKALVIRRATGSRAGEGWTLGDLGRLYLEHPGWRDAARAVAYLDSAAAVYASIRSDRGGDANAISLAEKYRTLFTTWTLAWLSRADAVGADASARAALAVAERGRAQALLDLLRIRRPTADAAQPGADLVSEADSFLAPIRRAGTTALSYLVAGDTLVRWLALPSGEVTASRVAIARDSLNALVAALRDSLEPPRTLMVSSRARAARALAALESAPADSTAAPSRLPRTPVSTASVLARLAEVLLPIEWRARPPAGGDVVVVPHGALALVPFGALRVGRSDEPLGVRVALRVAPSLATLAALSASEGRARPATPGGALVVGDPAPMPALPDAAGRLTPLDPLPAAQTEARRVAGLLGVRALVGRDATESLVRARLARAPVVHLATHGLAYGSDARARDSFVALAPDSVSDGLLTVDELLDDPALTLSADLVVLSACQTGLGNLTEAEGTVGLARAFLARGARSVVVSLWSVSDEAASLLMDRLYAHWLRDADRPGKAEALRRAQADMRRTRDFAHPRDWAAFQLVGAR